MSKLKIKKSCSQKNTFKFLPKWQNFSKSDHTDYNTTFFKKMGQPRPLFRLLSVFSNKHYNFYNNNMWKYVHPVYGAGIRTHDHKNFNTTWKWLNLKLQYFLHRWNSLAISRNEPHERNWNFDFNSDLHQKFNFQILK